MLPNLPDRHAVNDPFTGYILRVDVQHFLALAALPESEVVYQGDMMLRYGVQYLGKPQYSVVPELIALDYGTGIAGEEAWEFLLKRSNLYPRADVIGYRNDGADEMIVIKKLDVMAPIAVLAYENQQATIPVAQVTAIIAAEVDSFPARALAYLSRYDTLSDWRADQDE